MAATMDVILLQRIEKLGQMGDVVTVKPGYARNFLLPQKKALRATEANKTFFETQKAQLEADNLKRRQEAEAVAEKMDGVTVTLIRAASETGALYGSVSTRDVAEQVTEAGFTLNRSQVVLDKPIKELGVHELRVQLHPEVLVDIRANVAKSADEAEAQLAAADGKPVVSAEEEEAEALFETADEEADEGDEA